MTIADNLTSARRDTGMPCLDWDPQLASVFAWLARVWIVLVVLMSAWPAFITRADTVTVCTVGGCDHTTIQAAINSASTSAGDTISILDGVHTEAGILVDKSVSIAGLGASKTIVQAADDPGAAGDRVFTVADDVSVTIRDMTVRNGRVVGSPARGGGILNNGTLTVERSTLAGNSAVGADGSPGGTGAGGGVYNNGSMTVVRSTIVDNVARGGDGSSGDADGGDAHGGGIASSDGGTMALINTTISGNSALHGAGYT